MMTAPQEQLCVAMLQYSIVSDNPQANYDKILRLLEPAPHPIDILLLPETFTTAFTDKMALCAELPFGPSFRFVHEVAKSLDALVAGSWLVKEPSDGTLRNRMHLVQPDGTCATYDKAHLFRLSSEPAIVSKGSRRTVANWRGWRLMPMLCYDLRFPIWLRNHCKLNANGERELDYDLMLISANWPSVRSHAWTTLLAARAIENLAYVVGVNRCGDDGKGLMYSGDSLAVDYKGMPVAQCQPNCEGVQIASFSASRLAQFRSRNPFYLDGDTL